MRVEDLALRQEAHSARGPHKEGASELVLQVSDLPAERWLRNMKAAGSSPHVSFLGDGDEIAELSEAHAG